MGTSLEMPFGRFSAHYVGQVYLPKISHAMKVVAGSHELDVEALLSGHCQRQGKLPSALLLGKQQYEGQGRYGCLVRQASSSNMRTDHMRVLQSHRLTLWFDSEARQSVSRLSVHMPVSCTTSPLMSSLERALTPTQNAGFCGISQAWQARVSDRREAAQ